jgi:phage regulator Rha-like protein
MMDKLSFRRAARELAYLTSDGAALISSQRLAEIFGQDHAKLRRLLDRLLKYAPPNWILPRADTKPRSFYLNRSGFMFLLMNMAWQRDPTLLALVVEIVSIFHTMREAVDQPRHSRRYIAALQEQRLKKAFRSLLNRNRSDLKKKLGHRRACCIEGCAAVA